MVTLRFEGEGGIREQPLRNGCKGLKEGSKKKYWGDMEKSSRSLCCSAQDCLSCAPRQAGELGLGDVQSSVLEASG